MIKTISGIIVSLLCLALAFPLQAQKASASDISKFQKKKQFLVKDIYKDIYIYHKNHKYGITDNDLNILMKAKYPALIYDEGINKAIVAGEGSSHNDGGGKITNDFSNIRQLDIQSKKETPLPNLEGYIIPIKYRSSWIEPVDGRTYIVVQNSSTKKFNLIDGTGTLLLKNAADQITTPNSSGFFHAFQNSGSNMAQCDIVHVNGDVVHSGTNNPTGKYGPRTLVQKLNGTFLEHYGVTLDKGKYGIMDLKAKKEILPASYKEVKVHKKRGQKSEYLVAFDQNNRLTVFNTVKGAVLLKDFDGKILSYKNRKDIMEYTLKNKEGNQNVLSGHTQEYLYPIWYSKRIAAGGKDKRHLQILKVKSADGKVQSGIYDTTKNDFHTPMKAVDIKMKQAWKKGVGNHRTFYIEKNGKQVEVKLD